MKYLGRNHGFALPTVMIASVVMLMVLLSGLVASSGTNTALRTQYYLKLAKDAAEAGSAYAQACLKQSNYVAGWSAGAPLKPNTTCAGVQKAGFTCPAITSASVAEEPQCAVVETTKIRTSFEVSPVTGTTDEQRYTVKGFTYLMRGSGTTRSLASTQEMTLGGGIAFRNNVAASRPTQKFWYFGDRAGLDFGVSGPNATVISALCVTAPCRAGEGSTAISSSGGIMQFWTNGMTIWDRNGNAMPNGTGLLANGSTTQAAAVFPAGFDESEYVVVSNNAENGVKNYGELNYSVVDMRSRSGLGDVTTKNVPVWNSVNNYSSEASAAAPKSNGKGYWILTYSPGSTDIKVFSYNSVTRQVDGVQQFAQPAGVRQYAPSRSGFGSLNFNSDYSRLVMMAGNHCMNTCATESGLIRTMAFNTSTGVITNQNAWENYSAGQGYSADFSPGGNYIYTTTLYPSRLTRYSAATGSSDATIKSTEAYIGSVEPSTPSSCTGGGQVRQAPNAKMYVANCGTAYISVINNPDASIGAINFAYNGIPLNAGTQSWYGLPQTITMYTPTLLRF